MGYLGPSSDTTNGKSSNKRLASDIEDEGKDEKEPAMEPMVCTATNLYFPESVFSLDPRFANAPDSMLGV